MSKSFFYTYLVLLAGVVCINTMYAQTTPISGYDLLPGGINLPDPPPSGDKVCPSLDLNNNGLIDLPTEVSSNSVFSVNAQHDDMGNTADNTFEWVVYGGWVAGFQGNSIVSDHRYQSIEGTNRYSYVVIKGAATIESVLQSEITVEWGTNNSGTVNGWVAVRQSSEWGCSDGKWSVFTNTIQNNPPVFTEASFPSNIKLPYNLRLAYTLPLPPATDDGCNQTLTYSFTINLPSGGTINGTGVNTEVNLQQGVNTVTWTVTDGSLTDVGTYTITVEPLFEILNIAWTNPTCFGEDDGSLRITQTTAFTFNGEIQYSLNSSDPDDFSSQSAWDDLKADNYLIRARIKYSVDTDNNGVPEDYFQYAGTDPLESVAYAVSLASNKEKSVSEPLPDATITDSGCLNAETGKIVVDGTFISELNSSVNFGGGEYLRLNKNYSNETLNSFSVATWIKAGNSDGTLISFDNSRFFELGITYFSGSGVARVRFMTNTEEGVFVNNTPVNDSKWHLVVATYSNGIRTIYVDGVKATNNPSGLLVAGTLTETRYGMIGARSNSGTFGAAPSAPYFNGQMAEMAIWQGIVLGDDKVAKIMKHGIMSEKPTEHWVLNNTPVNVSPDYSAVFTDLGNRSQANNWARFVGGTLSANNSPKLAHWTNEGNQDIYPPSFTLENVGVGTYTLRVKDMLGCGEVSRAYTINNSDALAPELYWNAAVMKVNTRTVTAKLSTNSGSKLAPETVDGLSSTFSSTDNQPNAWWQVDLGGLFPVRTINIHPVSNFGNFWVMISANVFPESSTLAEDLARADVVRVQHAGNTSGTTAVRIIGNARYVRIRAVETNLISLSEVEVLTNQASTQPRTLAISSLTSNTNCYYELSANDISIAPFAYDACLVQSLIHNADHTSNTHLNGKQLTLGDHTFTWTATDDADNQSTFDITYRVVDNTPPVFDPNPFPVADANITFCASQVYQLPIPTVLDNNKACAPVELRLFNGSNNIYTYTDGDVETPVLHSHFLINVANNLQWRATDASGNQTVASLNLYVQRQPRILEVKVSPITCSSGNSAIVTFTKIESETGADVVYQLRNTAEPYAVIYTQTNNPVFTTVAEGTYRATISVNTCVSEPYFDPVIVVKPLPITIVEEVTPVACSGFADGAISLTVSGGSQSNILHFWGDDNGGATAGTYAAINLGTAGTVEGWVYLDLIGTAPGEKNYNTGLFGVAGAYGFTIVNGALHFFVGEETVTATVGDLVERRWHHISATWGNQLLTLTIDNSTTNSVAIPDAFAPPSGSNVYFAMLPGGGPTNGFQGFMRNLRIWDRVLTPSEIANNLYLFDPIDLNNNLAANYPISLGGGTTLQNRALKPGVTTASVGTNASWQRFAYYWENSSGELVSRVRNISNVVADTYTVYIDDLFGCSRAPYAVAIPIADTEAPTLVFSNNGNNGAPVLSFGEAIWRYTNDVNRGVLDPRNEWVDCNFYPGAKEFDPYITDGDCPAEDVNLTIEFLTGGLGITDPPTVLADGEQSLDGYPMTDISSIRWTATDRANNSRSQTISYYVVDNQQPVLILPAEVLRNTDPGVCFYEVKNIDVSDPDYDGYLGLQYQDNCNTGFLFHNINTNPTLTGVRFNGGNHTVTWTFNDRTFPGSYVPPLPLNAVATTTLRVIDNEPPTVMCKPGSLVFSLDDNGQYLLESDDIDNGSYDNCGALANLHVTKNIARGIAPATSGLAVDPWIQLQLTAPNTIYGINLISDDTPALEGFWVLISNNGTFYNPGIDWDDPVFTADVVFSRYVSASANPNAEVMLNQAALGQYIRIVKASAVPLEITLDAIEVYGTNNVATAHELPLSCDDILYTPHVNPYLQGTFNPQGVLLTAIDASGVINSCLKQFTLEDKIAPVAIARDITVELDNDGNASITAVSVNNGSTDNCGTDGMSFLLLDALNVEQVSMTFNCDIVGADFDFTLIAIDRYGNRDETTFNVLILDKEGPTLILAAEPVELPLNNRGEFVLTRTQILDLLVPGSFDNCGGVAGIVSIVAKRTDGRIGIDLDRFDCIDLADNPLLPVPDDQIEVKVIASDLYGNKDSVLVKVLVVDNIAPVARAKDYAFQLTGVAQPITKEMIDNGSYDNDYCGPLTFSFSPTETPTCAGDPQIVTLTVTDKSGRSSTANATITYLPVYAVKSIAATCSSSPVWSAEIEGSATNYYWRAIGFVDKNTGVLDSTSNNVVNKLDWFRVGGVNQRFANNIINPVYNEPSGVNQLVRFRLIVSNATCPAITYFQNIDMTPGAGQPAVITKPRLDLCQGTTVLFDTETTGGLSYTWYLNGVVIAGNTSFNNVTINSLGNNIVSCLIKISNKCNLEHKWPVVISETPIPSIVEQGYTGPGSYRTTVCPGETVTYEQNGLDERFNWQWVISTPFGGSIIDGGLNNQNSITIQWDNELVETSKIYLNATNINCSGSDSIGAIRIFDEQAPEFITTTSNAVLNTVANQCFAYLVPLDVPTARDLCNGAPCTSSDCYDITFTITGVTNPAFTLSGTDLTFRSQQLPVGTYSVVWTVTDNADNSASYTRTITVYDNQAPRFDNSLPNLSLLADANCEQFIPDGARPISATDNCSSSVITYTINIDYPVVPGYVDKTIVLNSVADAASIPYNITDPFPRGVTTVTITIADNAVNQEGNNNSRSTSFTVTVTDNTKPAFEPLDDIVYNIITNVCEATIPISPPGNDKISDNCTPDDLLVVSFFNRSDARALAATYPIGETTITWRLTDEAGNWANATQKVTVTDKFIPYFLPADVAFAARSVGYCRRNNITLRIPSPYDNCNGTVDKLFWKVYLDANNNGVLDAGESTIIDQGEITRATNFNPNGNGFTRVVNNIHNHATTGTNYIVTWDIVDLYGNKNFDNDVQDDDVAYHYPLRVEIEPYISDFSKLDMSCGNTPNGQIAVNIDPGMFRVEPGYTVYFTKDNWATEQYYIAGVREEPHIFTGLSGGTYNVQIRVNDCYSVALNPVIVQPEEYTMALTATAQPFCFDATYGVISVSMSGSVTQQALFTGSTASAAHYAALDLSNQGTIEMWVYFNDFDNPGEVVLLQKGSDYSLKLVNGSFSIQVNGATATMTTTIEKKRWYHVAGNWELGTGMSIDLDGAAQGLNTSGALAAFAPNSNGITIGQDLQGIIREVRIWNTSNAGVYRNEVTGLEVTLAAYWPLINQSGSNRRSGGESMSVAAGLWQTNLTQPGRYTWAHVKDGSTTAFTSRQADISELERGTYTLTFQDPRDCPDEGLVRSRIIEPTDREDPAIGSVGNPVVELTTACGVCDNCKYIVQLTDTHLWPEITDDCHFTTTWRVIPLKTLMPVSYSGEKGNDNKFIGATLELGDNRIEVRATQNNGENVSSSTYIITVIDKINPVASPRNDVSLKLSNNNIPMGSGIVFYDATGFNNTVTPSSDNCTTNPQLLRYKISDYVLQGGETEIPEAEWKDEIRFDCDDVGKEVQISFKVIDESGNEDVKIGTSGVNVSDEHKPVFTLGESEFRTVEACVTVDNDGPTPYTVLSAGSLVLDEFDYTDNCSVSHIDYAIYYGGSYIVPFEQDSEVDDWKGNDPSSDGLKFFEGTNEVWFRVVDPSGNISDPKKIYEVSILPKPEPGGGIR